MESSIYSVITGATSGIGESIAYKLASEEYNLVLLGRNTEKLISLEKQLVEKYNIKVLIYAMDIRDRKALQNFDKWLEEKQIKIEIFVNNAGVGSFGKFNEVSKEADMAIIDTNISGFTYLLKITAKYILKGGTILQVASTAAFAPGPYMSVYYASKAYVVSLSMAIREELKKDDIQISILCPGPTKTAFQKTAKMQKAEIVDRLTMNSKEVAEIAYQGMIRGKTMIVPGKLNRLAVIGMNSLPKGLNAKIIGMTQNK